MESENDRKRKNGRGESRLKFKDGKERILLLENFVETSRKSFVEPSNLVC